MKLPNWFRILWWTLLTSGLSWLLYSQQANLIAGRASSVDLLLLVVWIALMLMPLFQEVSLLGFKFKQEIEELKSFVALQVSDIRNEVRNAVDVRTTISPQITFPVPAPDAQLPELEAKIKTAVSEALASQGHKAEEASPANVSTPQDANFLFSVRYSIERELRRLTEYRIIAPDRRPIPAMRLSRVLVDEGVIEPRFEHAIREVYAVCSPAIHGQPVTSAQINFVKDVAPGLIAALQAID